MPKNFFQDMVKIKKEKKERINVPPPIQVSPRRIPPVAEPPVVFERNPVKEPKEEEFFIENKFASVDDTTDRPNNGKKSKRALWIVAIISFIFFIFAISYLFSKVVVTVNPKMQDAILDENLSASKDASNSDLAFDLMVIPGEESKNIPVTGEKDVSVKATGTVVIFNSFSSSPQRLDIDTRLEGSNGKIYKTVKQTIVPGMKGNTPGSLEVGIYAMNAGSEYNSGPLDFKIFGFKGTSKYSKFAVRTKTGTEITGGFVGKAPDISDADKKTTLIGLKSALQAKLFQKATDQIPSGFILFKDAVFLNADDSNFSSVYNKDNTATLTLKGTLYGFIFNEQKLTQKIAQDKIDKYDGSDVYLPNIRDLAFSLSNKDNVSFADVKSIDFNLSGTTKIVWRLDEAKFISDLLGKSKTDFSQILLQYKNIDSADLSISPFWRNSLPDRTKDIKVIVNYPK